jgi:hypothetical protein
MTLPATRSGDSSTGGVALGPLDDRVILHSTDTTEGARTLALVQGCE